MPEKINNYKELARISVLLIDNEEIIRDLFAEWLTPVVERVKTVPLGPESIEVILGADFDIILIDINSPHAGGMEFYKDIKKLKPHLADRFIFIPGSIVDELLVSSLSESGCEMLRKPFLIKELLMKMSDMIKRRLTPLAV